MTRLKPSDCDSAHKDRRDGVSFEGWKWMIPIPFGLLGPLSKVPGAFGKWAKRRRQKAWIRQALEEDNPNFPGHRRTLETLKIKAIAASDEGKYR